MTTISQRILHAISHSPFNQTEVGTRCGISKQAISAIVTGKTKDPKPEHVFRIADITGFEARWIATGKGPMTNAEAAKERLDISILSDDSKAAIRAVLHSLSKQPDGPQDGSSKQENSS